MEQVWKSQCYQLKREVLMYGIWAALMLFCVVILLVSTKPWTEEVRTLYTGSYAWTIAGTYQAPVALLFSLMISILVMGRDYGDQMICYDVLAGYTRKQVFWGRAVLAIMTAEAGAALIMVLAPFTLAVINGWGNDFPAWNYCIRTLVFLFLNLRVACEGIFIMVVGRKLKYAYAAATLLVFLEAGISEPPKNQLVMSETVGTAIFEVSGWASLGINGDIIMEYDRALPVTTLLLTVGFSVLMAVLMLAMAGFLFAEDDL